MITDKSNMIKVIDDFPVQCRSALALPQGIKAKGEVALVVVCGMGGSAIGGDILKSYCSSTKLPVLVSRGYTIPEFADEYTLVFAVSYSGDTEETLSSFYDAKRKNANIIAITSGGKLLKEAERAIRIPSGLQPRAALGYLFFPMLGVLYNSGLIDVKNAELNEMLSLLEQNEEIKETANGLAKKIQGRTPLIYSSELLKPAAYRWQTQINENAKYPAFHSAFPEMNHNGINAFRAMERNKFIAVLLRDEKDHPQIKKRMEICRAIIEEKIDVVDASIKGASLLARIFYAVYLGDYTSYYLALRERVDPAPVDVIEQLKKRLV